MCALFVMALCCVLPNLQGEIPNLVVTGQATDVSCFMHYYYWQEIFVELHKEDKQEELACWIMPAKNVGN